MPKIESTTWWTSHYLLYALTIFLSAFLLFVIQPIAGKYLLPWFGGSSSVWATSLLFFTGMLFVGYVYVYVLTQYGGRRQALIHGCVVAIAALATLSSMHTSLDWTIGSTASPSLNVLWALVGMIGAPYFLLSTTGPLLQYWYGLSSHREPLGRSSMGEPYKLYALSNAGSLLALIGYIFLIEPFIPLHLEESMWTVFFFVYAFMAFVISILLIRAPVHVFSPVEDASHTTITIRSVFSWILLAALPSFLLLATTTTITQTIAPVPLLWIVPLMIYLVTLILAFAGVGRSKFVPLLVLAAVYFAYSYTSIGSYTMFNVSSRIIAYVLLLFFVGLFCHAELYRRRPAISNLPFFYLFLSFGGMVGIFVGSILTPLIFSDFWEFPLCMAIAAALATWALSEEFFPRIFDTANITFSKIIFTLVTGALFFNLIYSDAGNPFIASRNFYGAVKVRFHDETITLMHGTTVHGFQPRANAFQYMPNSYYVGSSGIGRAMLYEQRIRKGSDFKAGILGLGTGSIAAYCRHGSIGSPQAGDTFVFYEIDPQMVTIAKSNFSYIQHCHGASIRMGDGRLLLEKERREGNLGTYDLLVADAFTDDTIPVHLITLEAVALYAAHLRTPQSIIAIHTSNRYLDLPPVILKIGAQLGFTAKIVLDDGSSSPIGSPSQWVLLAKDPKVFADTAFSGSTFAMPDMKRIPLWTDDYTSLLSVIRI
ncbi:MAG: fused MFS/spermidine synthase [bacterium]|nr:fused MFS/spermidine synthase [bacterium]